jgi:hypothetical protein
MSKLSLFAASGTKPAGRLPLASAGRGGSAMMKDVVVAFWCFVVWDAV